MKPAVHLLPALLLCWTVQVAEVLRVIDGDTFDATVAVWLAPLTGRAIVIPERVRVLGVDTPEVHGGTPESQAAAQRATAFTTAWLAKGGPVTVMACKRDSFGRLLAHVSRGAVDLADELVVAGLGVPR